VFWSQIGVPLEPEKIQITLSKLILSIRQAGIQLSDLIVKVELLPLIVGQLRSDTLQLVAKIAVRLMQFAFN